MGRMILHIADLHLGFRHDYLDAGAAGRAREADLVVDRLADWLTGPARPDVGALLIAGDLFDDPRPDAALVTRVATALARVDEAGIAVVTVPGNHDEWTYPDGVFRREKDAWPGVLVTSPAPVVAATLDLNGLAVEVASCAYQQGRNPPSSSWENPFAGPRGSGSRRIGLFHGTLDRIGGKVAEGERAFRLDFERFAGWGLDYLALGHIHRRQEFDAGACLALYPGPIEGKGFADPGSPALSLVDVSGSEARVTTVDAAALGIRSREVAVLVRDAAGIADQAHLEREIAEAAGPQDGARKILRVALRGRPSFPLSREEIEGKLADRFYHLEVVAEEPAADLGAWESLAMQRTLEGVFVAKVLDARPHEPAPEEARFWDEVASAGLRALGRGTA